MFSNTAITVDNAANDMNTKNAVPHILPPAIWLNMLGSVINKSDGPAPGATPYAKPAGIIMNPAIRATNVSSRMILTASPPIVLSFFK